LVLSICDAAAARNGSGVDGCPMVCSRSKAPMETVLTTPTLNEMFYAIS
jgi:hypothetical protein